MAEIGIEFHEDEMFKPGIYADDVPVILLMTSVGLVFAGVISFVLDGWQGASFFLLQAIYFLLLYSHLEKRP